MQQLTANKKTKFYDNPDVDLKANELVKPIASSRHCGLWLAV